MVEKSRKRMVDSVDKRLTEPPMFSIRDFRYTDHPDYHHLTDLVDMVE